MTISREDVRYVAELSRLELTAEEEEVFQEQLSRVLEYVDQIQEVEIEGVEPYISAAAEGNVFRADEVREPLAPAEAVANAAEHDEDGFVVPKVVGGAGGEA